MLWLIANTLTLRRDWHLNNAFKNFFLITKYYFRHSIRKITFPMLHKFPEVEMLPGVEVRDNFFASFLLLDKTLRHL